MADEQSSDRQTAAPAPPGRHSIFFGAQGLRAGWACAAFLGLVVAIGFALNLSLSVVLRRLALPLRPAPPLPPLFIIVGEGLSFLAVFCATWLMARLGRRRLGAFGLGDRAWLGRFGGGLAAGFASISVLVGGLWALHVLVLTGTSLPAATVWAYGLKWAGGFLMVALFEESLLRGYLLFTLARGIGFWWGALLLSVLFGASHGSNGGETPIGLFSAGAVGLVFCLSIRYTGSLWWALGFHAAWDWGQSFFWGTLDSGQAVQGHWLAAQPAGSRLLSGGATGPEGSLLVFPVLLLVAGGVFLWWGRPGALQTGPIAQPEPGT